ncbi:hypothetical protein [Apibacter sp.]|nr:hypothetical protein [Apibacter sp.]
MRLYNDLLESQNIGSIVLLKIINQLLKLKKYSPLFAFREYNEAY